MLWKLLPVGLSYVLLQVTLRFKDDSDLAKRLQDRDPRAMSDLYERYGRLAYSLIYRVVRNTGAAEDLVQETFLRVWNRVQSFDQTRGALGPWVLTVARNRAIDYLRSVDGKMSAGALELELPDLDQPPLVASLGTGPGRAAPGVGRQQMQAAGVHEPVPLREAADGRR